VYLPPRFLGQPRLWWLQLVHPDFPPAASGASRRSPVGSLAPAPDGEEEFPAGLQPRAALEGEGSVRASSGSAQAAARAGGKPAPGPSRQRRGTGRPPADAARKEKPRELGRKIPARRNPVGNRPQLPHPQRESHLPAPRFPTCPKPPKGCGMGRGRSGVGRRRGRPALLGAGAGPTGLDPPMDTIAGNFALSEPVQAAAAIAPRASTRPDFIATRCRSLARAFGRRKHLRVPAGGWSWGEGSSQPSEDCRKGGGSGGEFHFSNKTLNLVLRQQGIGPGPQGSGRKGRSGETPRKTPSRRRGRGCRQGLGARGAGAPGARRGEAEERGTAAARGELVQGRLLSANRW